MHEIQLLDEKDDRVYLVYMTNRQDSFKLFERDMSQMMERASVEISIGYTNLWAMKRIGIIEKEKVCYFPDNELLIEPASFLHHEKQEVYIIFLFVKSNPSVPFMFSKRMNMEPYMRFEAAVEAGCRLIELMENTYPGREFKVLCAKLLYDIPWH
ncbi:MAG TPA: hypothetical protein VLQ20_08700 [Planococcus sp. (in: firmicutes)]|nr:hypothetical protein [Planococcus sp. (in: firmicutes)]